MKTIGQYQYHSEFALDKEYEPSLGIGSDPDIPGPECEFINCEGTGPQTVLVVDDDNIVRHAAGRILEKMGYRVIQAENGQVALDLYKSHQDDVSLVILDMIMPVLNGRDTLTQIRELAPNLKVLLVSAYTWNQKIDDLLHDNITEFVNKPFDIDSLSAGIAKLQS